MDALSPPATNADALLGKGGHTGSENEGECRMTNDMFNEVRRDGWLDGPPHRHLDAGLRTTTAGQTIVSTYIISAERYSAAFIGRSPCLPACYMTLKAVEECQFISSVSPSGIDDR